MLALSLLEGCSQKVDHAMQALFGFCKQFLKNPFFLKRLFDIIKTRKKSQFKSQHSN